ncbi:MAG: c-type cytochrome [Turneriella sp.]|nr:c-type cytochrome [Turneriella sp.]
MRITQKARLAALGVAFVYAACRAENPVLSVHEYAHPKVVRFLGPMPEPETNRFRPEVIHLGRKLFYEPKLSANGKVSCATCHEQSQGFSDGVALATTGVSGKPATRNSPALINLAWSNNGLFWDGGAKNLESQLLGPLHNPDEMGQAIGVSLDKLKADSSYRRAFEKAFPDQQVSITNLLQAIAQFVRTLVSFDSLYDRVLRQEAMLNDAEARGRNLFTGNCAVCHNGPLMTDNDYHNNGIDTTYPPIHDGQPMGRFRITRKDADIGKFRTPTLRNIAVTRPYMHDGRFATLEAVIEHYSSGIKRSATLDGKLPAGGFHFSAQDKADLKEFLLTLTDENFLKRKEFRLD